MKPLGLKDYVWGFFATIISFVIAGAILGVIAGLVLIGLTSLSDVIYRFMVVGETLGIALFIFWKGFRDLMADIQRK